MGTTITLTMNDADRIILDTHLGSGGKVEQFFASQLARAMDPYVPFDTGDLKNTHTVGKNYVEYHMPYAARQYHENKSGHNGLLRGKEWDKRCWLDRRKDLIQAIQGFVEKGD
jgi:hypothetical protein